MEKNALERVQVMDFWNFMEEHFLILLGCNFAALILFSVAPLISFGGKKQSDSELAAPNYETDLPKEAKV
jgi:hypothetical protein